MGVPSFILEMELQPLTRWGGYLMVGVPGNIAIATVASMRREKQVQEIGLAGEGVPSWQ